MFYSGNLSLGVPVSLCLFPPMEAKDEMEALFFPELLPFSSFSCLKGKRRIIATHPQTAAKPTWHSVPPHILAHVTGGQNSGSSTPSHSVQELFYPVPENNKKKMKKSQRRCVCRDLLFFFTQLLQTLTQMSPNQVQLLAAFSLAQRERRESGESVRRERERKKRRGKIPSRVVCLCDSKTSGSPSFRITTTSECLDVN